MPVFRILFVVGLLAALTPLIAACNGDPMAASSRTADASPQGLPPHSQPATSLGETLPVVVVHGDYLFHDDTIEELLGKSTLVAKGKVTGLTYVVDAETGLASTLTTVTLNKVLLGDARAGDSIRVMEAGGVTTKANDIRANKNKFGGPTAADESIKYVQLLDGQPLKNLGDQCVYFLASAPADDRSVSPFYYPVGGFFGEFAIRNGNAERHVPDGWNQDRMRMSVGELERLIATKKGTQR